MFKQQLHQGSILQQFPYLLEYTLESLKKRKFILAFPAVLEAQFVAKRAAESQAFINTGRYLLILLFLLIVTNVTFYYDYIILTNNYQIIRQTYIPLSIAITFILFSPFIRYVRDYFYYFMALCAIFIIYHILILTFEYNGDYSNFVVYHLMMAIILMAFGLRFVLPLFVIVLVSAASLSIGVAEFRDLSINYAKFSNYYILYSCVVIALTAISEWHERLAFFTKFIIRSSIFRIKYIK